jgi:hypothetical protein
MIETSIFLEKKTNELPFWTAVSIDEKAYKIKEIVEVKSPFIVGKNKQDESPITITIRPNNFLYRITIVPIDPENLEMKNINLISQTTAGASEILRLNKKVVQLLPQMIP